mmetsp:Transcript_22985/g.48930  ORF Transcript_22985/g.48930 Transcript_22985/m.48930 type:complete len:288 (+) Transcript_22985:634-1497(+)
MRDRRLQRRLVDARDAVHLVGVLEAEPSVARLHRGYRIVAECGERVVHETKGVPRTGSEVRVARERTHGNHIDATSEGRRFSLDFSSHFPPVRLQEIGRELDGREPIVVVGRSNDRVGVQEHRMVVCLGYAQSVAANSKGNRLFGNGIDTVVAAAVGASGIFLEDFHRRGPSVSNECLSCFGFRLRVVIEQIDDLDLGVVEQKHQLQVLHFPQLQQWRRLYCLQNVISGNIVHHVARCFVRHTAVGFVFFWRRRQHHVSGHGLVVVPPRTRVVVCCGSFGRFVVIRG